MNDKKVYYITGASKGFGLCLTNNLLKQGHCVVSTSRSKDKLIKNVDSLANDKNFLPLSVDITSEESVKKSIEETIKKFNRIDVLINNAGYGLCGTIEELTDKEIKDEFECNVFGAIHTIRHALPHMRSNKHSPDGPRIINIGSIAGFSGSFPAFSIYSATKFAIDGLSEGLNEDLKEFNIHVSSVKPGYFRTSFLDKVSVAIPSHPLKQYTAVRKAEEAHLKEINYKQSGDPEKGAKSIIELSLMKNPPVHFFLGPDAVKLAKDKIKTIEKDIESLNDLSTSTNFEESK